MQRGVLLSLVALLTLPLLGSGTVANEPGLVLEAIEVQTPDGPVHGRLGYIDGSTPTRLVVFAHGYGWSVDTAWLHHINRTVRVDTAVVATDFRDNYGFPALRGAHDTIQATLLAKERFPTIDTVYLLGISMGGAISGTAIAEAGPASGGLGLFDHWITMEPVSMLHETYYQARAVGHGAAAAIERDTGGSFEEVPQEYLRRSPAVRTHEMAALGLGSAFVVHALNDGLVPYDQGRALATALFAAGIPTKMVTVTRDSPEQDSGTTGTNAIFGSAMSSDPNDSLETDLTGHGWEGDYDHPVIRTGFEALEAMLDGDHIKLTYEEAVVDDKL